MHIDKENAELSWISMVLRVAMASLFAVAAYGKFTGLENYTAMIMGMFKDTFLPAWLLSPYVNLLPYAEALAAIWLLVGVKLREAWVFTAFLLVSLAFGIMVIKQSAADNFVFVLVACLGLYASRYDACALGKCCKK
ncbi:MAG: hypothetical protein Q7K71_01535 [Candidatus Omnitrophota bacterium]|nr:hypothetical protein [Candidatus Omnitrophota bacterium]